MNRATKLLIALWAAAAIAIHLWIVPSPWPAFKTYVIVGFVAMALLTAINRRFIGIVLLFAYIYPALIYWRSGRYHIDYDILWLAALAGAIMPDALRTPWRIPSKWRAALVLWGLVVAIAATIVMFREIDFYPGVLREPPFLNAKSGGGGPGFLWLWLSDVSLAFVVGILWFDWLFGAQLDFHRDVAAPLLLSVLALAAVAAYQLFFDFTFLNANVFGGMGRASGSMFDANASGAIAALWTAGAIAWAYQLRRGGAAAAIALCLAAWVPVWASGSRGAFLTAAIATSLAMVALRGEIRRVMSRRRLGFVAIAVVGALTAVWLLAHANPEIVGPITRVRETLPQPTVSSVRQFAWDMWDRNRYGTVAVAMIRKFPLFGIGISCYHMMVNDFVVEGDEGLIPDNAQNWYRHQLTELGVIGSVGWIAWLLTFGWFVVKPPVTPPPVAGVTRGMLVGIAIVSLIGMPSQVLAVAFTFWTAAYWYVSLVGAPASSSRLSRNSWIVVATVALLFGAGTLAYATTSLRVPARAQRIGFPFSYGFYYPEPDGSGGEYRWTRQRASMVVAAPSRIVALSAWVNHTDIATNPVDVKIWCDGVLVMQTTLRNVSAKTAYVVLPSEPRFIIDTWVSRVVRPQDFGMDDSRDLGLMVRWTFVRRVPDGAREVPLH